MTETDHCYYRATFCLTFRKNI
uniref:Uncharacterized protein n=1 Tax=Anguilla anguilla TaxID=7936 RepID=A0A0E9VPW6_ANGAN